MSLQPSPTGHPQVKRLYENVLSSFASVSVRKMFGATAFFISGNIVGFVGNDGEAAVKVLDTKVFAAALELDGVHPFRPRAEGPAMRHWLVFDLAIFLVDDLEELLEFAALDVAHLPAKEAKNRRQPLRRQTPQKK